MIRASWPLCCPAYMGIHECASEFAVFSGVKDIYAVACRGLRFKRL